MNQKRYDDTLVRRIIITRERMAIIENIDPKRPFIPVELAYPELVTLHEQEAKAREIERTGFVAMDVYFKGKKPDYIDVRRIYYKGKELSPNEVTSKIIGEIIPVQAKASDEDIARFLRDHYLSYYKRRN